jgi:hypothetical protein
VKQGNERNNRANLKILIRRSRNTKVVEGAAVRILYSLTSGGGTKRSDLWVKGEKQLQQLLGSSYPRPLASVSGEKDE